MANELFNSVPMARVPRNNFDLSHEVKTSFDIGRLVPLPPIDCVPGDYIRITPEMMLRFAPLVAPVMHHVDAFVHYFFVPYRILWDGFEEFITNPDSGLVAPYVTLSPSGNFSGMINSIGCYLGVPDADLNDSVNISPFYFAAYRMIYDEFYRDQNLINEVFVPLVAGENDLYGYDQLEGSPPLLRSLEHDYFTSCLPFAQKGDPVMLPLTFTAGIPVQLNTPDGTPGIIRDADDGSLLPGTPLYADAVNATLQSGSDTGGAIYDPNGTLSVDIQSNAVTLAVLRSAITLQEFLERDARGGTRYIEKIQAHFNVRSSDARLQRPEYIGGVRQVFAISEVLSTAQSSNDPGTATQFVGQMAGHGLSVGGGNSFSKRIEEFGCIVPIVSVLPETAYQQGLHRSWIKADPIEDFVWPSFANLGEQIVTDKEVYLEAAVAEGEFGYQARYAQFKSLPSRVTGEFMDTLSFWHMGQIFDTEPSLNQDFIEANPAKFSRIFAVDESQANQIYARIVNRVYASRPLPRYGIPSFGSTSVGG